MKNKTRFSALSLVLCIILTLALSAFSPIISFADEDVIYIYTAEEFTEFAKKCSYDSWSVGKSFVLKNDISLEGIDFEPAASFGGSFDGEGHTISGIYINGAYSPAGLFSTVTATGVIKNLRVSGVVSPDGDKGYVGGIAGENLGIIEKCSFDGTIIASKNVGGIAGINKHSGTLQECSVYGEIIGENRTGGIVGSNEGLVCSCNNSAKVNTVALNPSLSLDEINLSLTLDLTNLPSLNNSTMTDIGGIAGYSSGIIMGCTNDGAVGYPHIGYNIGGIAGRSNGHLNGNQNNGEINGRKDVGGIVGQVEPFVSYDLSEDLLLALKNELDLMTESVRAALGSAENGIPSVSLRLNSILTNLEGATASLNNLINDTTDYGEDFFTEINRIAEVLHEVINQVSEITDEAPELARLLEASLVNLGSMIENIRNFSSISSGALADIASATSNASSAFITLGSAIENINLALDKFKNSITFNDKDAAKTALTQILDELSNLIHATDIFAGALDEVVNVLGDTAWMDDVIDHIEDAIEIAQSINESISAIYNSISTLRDNIDINWSKMEESGEEICAFIGYITDVSVHLSDSIKFMQNGFNAISDGIVSLSDTVKIKDSDAVKIALENIEVGFEAIIAATGSLADALGELGELLGEVSGDKLDEIIPGLSNAITEISSSLSDLTDAVTVITEELDAIFSNVEISPDKIGTGMSLIIAAAGEFLSALESGGEALISLGDAMVALDNAITSLKEAVAVGDKDKISAALDELYNTFGDLISTADDLTALMSDTVETLREAKVWGDDLVSAFSSVTSALTQMSEAFANIQDGIDALRKNQSFDTDEFKQGLGFIYDGLQDLSDASVLIGNCFADISSALTKIDSGSGYLNTALLELQETTYSLKVAMDIVGDMSEEINLLIGYLKGVDPITFPIPPQSMTDTANQLFVYLMAIEGDLKGLNGDVSQLSSNLVESLSNINDIFDRLKNNSVDAIYSLNDSSYIDDSVSEEEIDQITNGKLFACINNGKVYGDKNVGGIGGAMGLEFALDPEDDLTEEPSVTQKKQYKMKAVIHACINTGNVGAKYDYVGGVVGKMDIGLIYGSETYCDVTSEAGSYVGGIAGLSGGLISQCFAKSSLSGDKYIGGIVGSGINEDISGGSSTVRNCYSMVNITKYTQYAGAIAGINAGVFCENLFVSDTLAGIDRVSYQGKAEPITYEDLIKRRSVPDGFYHFTLEFMADGKLLHSVNFEYGTSFDKSIFPEIPFKEGHYGYWEVDELTKLSFDTVVNVVYKPYTTAIGSEEKRDDGREIVFVQGEFTENDSLVLNKGANTSGLVLDDSIFTKDTLMESFTLVIPKDNLDKNNIHLLPTGKNCRVFVKIDGNWYDTNAKEFGSYLVFAAEGETVEIAVVQHTIKLTPVILLSSAILMLIATAIVLIIIRKKKNRQTSN